MGRDSFSCPSCHLISHIAPPPQGEKGGETDPLYIVSALLINRNWQFAHSSAKHILSTSKNVSPSKFEVVEGSLLPPPLKMYYLVTQPFFVTNEAINSFLLSCPILINNHRNQSSSSIILNHHHHQSSLSITQDRCQAVVILHQEFPFPRNYRNGNSNPLQVTKPIQRIGGGVFAPPPMELINIPQFIN